MLFLPREEGQGLVEYALLILFIAIVVLVVLAVFGTSIGNLFSTVVDGFQTAFEGG